MFDDRTDAGRRLAGELARYRTEHPVVLGLPRGGVVVASEVARVLGAPLEVLPARKIYAPGRPDDAIGAVAPGVLYLNEALIRRLGIGRRYVELTIEEETRELALQQQRFRGDRPFVELAGRTVILVDDGAATGATGAAAAQFVRREESGTLVFAAPVCAPQALEILEERFDTVVALEVPAEFIAVGKSYRSFAPVTDDDVLAVLRRLRNA